MKNEEQIIAVKTNCYKGFSAEETFEGIAKAGYRYVELSATPGSNTGISRFESFTKICETKKMLDRLNLIPLGMGGHTNIMDEDLIEDFINNIYLAHFFGCKYIVTSVGDAHKEEDAIASNEIVAEHIQRFIPYLEKYDMQLVIELHGKHNTGKILKEIIKLVNNKRVSINYDTGNAIYSGGLSNEELLQDIEGCVDQIGYMHLKDKAGQRNEWDFPALGKGYVPLKEILNILEKHHNNCPLVVEIEFTPQGVKNVEEVDEAIQFSIKTLKQLSI